MRHLKALALLLLGAPLFLTVVATPSYASDLPYAVGEPGCFTHWYSPWHHDCSGRDLYRQVFWDEHGNNPNGFRAAALALAAPVGVHGDANDALTIVDGTEVGLNNGNYGCVRGAMLSYIRWTVSDKDSVDKLGALLSFEATNMFPTGAWNSGYTVFKAVMDKVPAGLKAINVLFNYYAPSATKVFDAAASEASDLSAHDLALDLYGCGL